MTNANEVVSIKINNKWYDFKAPFECICCRKIISREQFMFSMLCAYCDLGQCGSRLSKFEDGHGHKVDELINDKGKLNIKLNIIEKLK